MLTDWHWCYENPKEAAAALDNALAERERTIAALRSKEATDAAERAITDLFGDDGLATDDRLAAQVALAAAADWLETTTLRPLRGAVGGRSRRPRNALIGGA